MAAHQERATPTPSRAGTSKITRAAFSPAARNRKSPKIFRRGRSACQPPARRRSPIPGRSEVSHAAHHRSHARHAIAEHPPSGDAWLYEVKWDGVRAICFIEDNQLRIFSRTQKRCDQQYPELTVLPRFLNASTAILDGEIAVLDEKGRSSFSLIQPRISVADPNCIAHLARSTPVTLFLFDLLYLDGYDLRGVPLEERKRAARGNRDPHRPYPLLRSLRRQRRRNARSRARSWTGRHPRQTPRQ